MNNIQTLKGFRDFLPSQMALRERILTIFKDVFVLFGFAPLQTPTLEYAEVLMGKYGEEADKLLYTFEDRGGRRIGLNYDLTVPLARVLSQYQDIPKPFKRYQIQPSYRAENPQRGRYRQFTQCDVDTVGATSELSDAEIIAVIYTALKRIGFTNFIIQINDRQIFNNLVQDGLIPEEKLTDVIRSVDKLDKIGRTGVTAELLGKGYEAGLIEAVLNKLMRSEKTERLEKIFSYLKLLEVDEANFSFSPVLARGLDYYTSTIFEAIIPDAGIGSVAGGGRYDNLIKTLGGPNLPAVGTTIGLDRICDVIEDNDLFPNLQNAAVTVLVTIFSEELISNSLKICSKLRLNNIPTELYADATSKIEKQMKYADQKKIEHVLIIGPEEAAQNMFTVKNLKTREQKTVALEELINILKK